MTATTFGTPQGTYKTIVIRRDTPDRLVHINRTLTRITQLAIVGPVKKLPNDEYQVPCMIACRQGSVYWLATAYRDSRHGWRLHGDIYLPSYAAIPIRKAIFNAIDESITSEQRVTSSPPDWPPRYTGGDC